MCRLRVVASSPSSPAHCCHETLRLDITPTACTRCGLVLTHHDKRCSAISLVNDGGECFEPLTTTRYGRNTMPITKLKLAPITH